MAAFILFLVLSCSLSFIMAAWQSVALLAAIVWGATLITAGLYLKRGQLLVIFAANTLLMCYFGGWLNALYLLALCGLSMMIMAYMAWRGADYYEMQKAGIAIAIVAVSLFLGLTFFQTGDNWKTELETQITTYINQSLESYEDAGLLKLYAEQGITRQDIEQGVHNFIRVIIRHLWAIFYLQAIMTVFFALLLATIINRKRHGERLKKKPYREEIMSWQLVWVIIAGLALCLWGNYRNNTQLFYIGSNILVVLVPITIYYGLAAVIYKIGQVRQAYRRWFIITLVILSTFFLPSALIFFSIFGMFDALLDYRKLRIEKGD